MERSLLTTSEVAEALGVTSARIRQMVLSGLLPAEKAGRDVLIPVTAVDAAKERKTKPGPIPRAATGAAQAVPVASAAKPKRKRVKIEDAPVTAAKPKRKRAGKKANKARVKS